MRLFIAVPVSEEVRKEVRALIEALSQGGADFKWVDPANVHLTLAFLGETGPDKLAPIKEALARAVAGRRPFDVTFEGLDAFGSLDYPRVLWIPVREGEERLRELARALRGELAASGLLPDDERRRDFRAHLTLGRMRSPRNLYGLKEIVKKAPPRVFARCRAEKLALFESRLTPEGPVYSALAESPLT